MTERDNQLDPDATYIYSTPRARSIGAGARFHDIPLGTIAYAIRKKATGGFYFKLQGFEQDFYTLTGKYLILNTPDNLSVLQRYHSFRDARDKAATAMNEESKKLATLEYITTNQDCGELVFKRLV